MHDAYMLTLWAGHYASYGYLMEQFAHPVVASHAFLIMQLKE
jgi:hypothetical protein